MQAFKSPSVQTVVYEYRLKFFFQFTKANVGVKRYFWRRGVAENRRLVVFIARQHHSAILFYRFCPSVRLSNAGIVSKRMHLSLRLKKFW